MSSSPGTNVQMPTAFKLLKIRLLTASAVLLRNGRWGQRPYKLNFNFFAQLKKDLRRELFYA